MFDLDKYIYVQEEVRIFGETIHVYQPSVGDYMKMAQIESDLTKENLLDKRIQIAEIILNNNTEGKKFTREMIAEKMNRVSIEALILRVNTMKAEADKDPN